MDSTLPWYRSRIIVGAIISALTKLAVLSGLVGEVAPEQETEITNAIVLGAGALADLWIMFARVKQMDSPKITAKKGIRDV